MLKADEDRENALVGHSLLFDVFAPPNPAKYMSFSNYVFAKRVSVLENSRSYRLGRSLSAPVRALRSIGEK